MSRSLAQKLSRRIWPRNPQRNPRDSAYAAAAGVTTGRVRGLLNPAAEEPGVGPGPANVLCQALGHGIAESPRQLFIEKSDKICAGESSHPL